MKIKQVPVGPMENFSYLVWDEKTGSAAVVDPAWDPAGLAAALAPLKLTLRRVLLTHAHPDHCNAAAAVMKAFPSAEGAYHKADAFMAPPELSSFAGLADGEKLALGESRLEVLHTPGHTPGSCCFYFKGHVITGDTLFVGECGRVDLPGSDASKLRSSLERLSRLPEDTAVWPGHAYNGSTTTIGAQKLHNIYMKLAATDPDGFMTAIS